MLPELRILLVACKPIISEQEKAYLKELASGDLDWALLLQGADVNRVAYYLCKHMLPFAEDDNLKKVMFSQVATTMQHVHRLKECFEKVLPALLKDQEDILLLRGIAYYYDMYKEQAPRLAGDIDLLIKNPSRFSITGFFRDHYPVAEEVQALVPEDMDVEYHRDLGVYTYWGLRTANFPMKSFWQRAHELEVNGSKLKVLDPLDNFLYLCHHNLTKGMIKLYRYCDLYEIIEHHKLDLPLIAERAKEYQVNGAVWINLKILQDIYGESFVSDSLLAQLGVSDKAQQKMLELLDYQSIMFDPNPVLQYRFADAQANRKRITLIRLGLKSPYNFWKMWFTPITTTLLSWHYNLGKKIR